MSMAQQFVVVITVSLIDVNTMLEKSKTLEWWTHTRPYMLAENFCSANNVDHFEGVNKSICLDNHLPWLILLICTATICGACRVSMMYSKEESKTRNKGRHTYLYSNPKIKAYGIKYDGRRKRLFFNEYEEGPFVVDDTSTKHASMRLLIDLR